MDNTARERYETNNNKNLAFETMLQDMTQNKLIVAPQETYDSDNEAKLKLFLLKSLQS